MKRDELPFAGWAIVAMSVIVFMVIGLAVDTVAVAWHGYVGFRLWEWFGVPVGLPHITVLGMIGLCILIRMPFGISISLLNRKLDKIRGPEEGAELFKSLGVQILYNFTIPLAAFGLGALIYWLQLHK